MDAPKQILEVVLVVAVKTERERRVYVRQSSLASPAVRNFIFDLIYPFHHRFAFVSRDYI